MQIGGFNPNTPMNPSLFPIQNMKSNFVIPFFPPPFIFQNQVQSQPQQQSQGENWTLIFEIKYDVNKINFQVNSDDTVISAFKNDKIKSLESDIPLKFTYNKKPLDSNLPLSDSGLKNNSVIEVEKKIFNLLRLCLDF